ncbi:DUF6247 family protein [Nonomuraea sp. NPDC050536]|uniref:DUF6247 family protein n=1 Tax=Nonomuraea sp. NPDC050536 TaxID=3364366 RepID=UPI0037C51ECB
MTAEPLHALEDPAEILSVLPERWHAQFLGEYHTALEAAHEVWQFKQLREVLHRWHLRAAAFSHQDFDRAEQAALEGRREEFVSAKDVIPGWPRGL